ncbi:MAG: 2-oxoacid:acceptor oxidoreductase family protein [Armatimonadetes bacterium]|nr:2-oxoacid:acceptor oxidoreductase family protein [Armatimonadota bacterium]MDW8122754.1 2-oxoacid:acceptor oxidoreductase family protein [Armatimonadota bacterium]
MIIEIRWHARAGQGAKTGANILAQAAIRQGKYAQSFPEFGPERRGAPVQAFNRISDEPFTIHSGVTEPDIVIVLDPKLVGNVPITDGLKAGGWIFLNAPIGAREAQERFGWQAFRVVTCDASGLSKRTLKRDIPNVPILGALAARAGVVALESLQTESISRLAKGRGTDDPVVKANLEALALGYEETDFADVHTQSLPSSGTKPPLPAWYELPVAGVIDRGGTAQVYQTGGWRLKRPELDLNVCVHCLMCWLVCPDSAILLSGARIIGIDYRHCKGCGLCETQCPPRARAIKMVEEEALQPAEKTP